MSMRERSNGGRKRSLQLKHNDTIHSGKRLGETLEERTGAWPETRMPGEVVAPI